MTYSYYNLYYLPVMNDLILYFWGLIEDGKKEPYLIFTKSIKKYE